MKKVLPKILLGVLVVVLGAQLIRPEKTNPPVTGEIATSPEVKSLLKRACYDCHSNETTWPWYSNVAPISWLVIDHVNEGRRELNFSEWAGYEPKRQAHKLDEVAREIEAGDMPLSGYAPMHPEAKLTDAEKKTLIDWAKTK